MKFNRYNNFKLKGTIVAEPYEIGNGLLEAQIEVPRTSGRVDTLPLVFLDNQYTPADGLKFDAFFAASGEIVSQRQADTHIAKPKGYCYSFDMNPPVNDDPLTFNSVHLKGHIVKPPTTQTIPNAETGRGDLLATKWGMLARQRNKRIHSDMITCKCYEDLAQYATRFRREDFISVSGRFQSEKNEKLGVSQHHVVINHIDKF